MPKVDIKRVSGFEYGGVTYNTRQEAVDAATRSELVAIMGAMPAGDNVVEYMVKNADALSRALAEVAKATGQRERKPRVPRDPNAPPARRGRKPRNVAAPEQTAAAA